MLYGAHSIEETGDCAPEEKELRVRQVAVEAVREKNERTKAEHIAGLTRELAAEHLAFDESVAGSLKAGL